ncbi:MAG: aromatic ring-hydroxylating dioxygenase subunit alpha [Candidatus Eisenbacteria bacterium]
MSQASPLALVDYWYIAARSRELKGRPIARTLLGRPIVLFRGASGLPGAMEDRCAHRNLALSAGRVESGLLRCAYHGWGYDPEGRCADIPALPRGTDCPAIRVRAYPACESDGFVWVYMGERAPVGPPRRFPRHGERGWTSFLLVNRFQAGAHACLENFLDCPHTAYVHTGWFRSRRERPVRTVIRHRDDGVLAEFHEERDAESLVSRLLFPRDRKLEHVDRFVMPTTSQVDYRFGPDRHYIITSQCTPISEEETQVYTLLTFRFGAIGPLVRLFFEPISRRIIRQDVDVLREQTENLRRFGGARFVNTRADLLGPEILRLWRDASLRSGEPKPPLPAERELEIRF